MFSTSFLYRFVQTPYYAHFGVAKGVPISKDYGLWNFEKNVETKLVGYCDSDWVVIKMTWKHFRLYGFFGSWILSWSSKKQQSLLDSR